MLGKLIFFFQDQGIVREFCSVSGKNEILQEMSKKCRGILHFSLMKLKYLVPVYFSC